MAFQALGTLLCGQKSKAPVDSDSKIGLSNRKSNCDAKTRKEPEESSGDELGDFGLGESGGAADSDEIDNLDPGKSDDAGDSDKVDYLKPEESGGDNYEIIDSEIEEISDNYSSDESEPGVSSDDENVEDRVDSENEIEESDDHAHCAVCDKKAELTCERCGEEDYCGEEHLKEHLKEHKGVCFPKGEEVAESSDENEDTPGVIQDSLLLELPYSVLVNVCEYLDVEDLVKLRWVCRHLRSVARDKSVWKHAEFPEFWDNYRCLRFAPALHTLTVSFKWPPVNLLRCTKNVKVFVLDWDDCTCEYEEGFQPERIARVLKHYKGYLEVVRLGELRDMKLMKVIDSLNIRELYVAWTLVKTYPGSSLVLSELRLGKEVSEEVASDLIAACGENLLSFRVNTETMDKNRWAFSYTSPVTTALRKCPNLERANILPWGRLSVLNSLSKLRKLCLYEFGDHPHGKAEAFFLTSPVMRNLERLSLHLGYRGHRGLIKAVALGCHNLKELRLIYSSSDVYGNITVTVDVPRDLHLLLGYLGNLEILSLSVARVPFTVINGIAAGALPYLKELKLDFCRGTKKARTAVLQLKASRADLRVTGPKPRRAIRHDLEDFFEPFELRCHGAICRQLSDCEEDDPIRDPDSNDSDSDGGWY